MSEAFEQWAIVELMGHVRVAGRVTEEEHFGSKLGRIDIPRPEYPCGTCAGGGKVLPLETGTTCPDCEGTGKTGGGFTTQFFGGSSVYRLTPVAEEVANQVAYKSQPAPVGQWEMPKMIAAAPGREDDGWDDDR